MRPKEAGSMADRSSTGNSGHEVSSPDAQVRALYEQAEARTAQALEELATTPSFGVLLARSAENVAALARMGSDFADSVLRNLRLAGRADVARLARQLHRTEDKVELLLQEVEALRDELGRRGGADAGDEDEVAALVAERSEG